ncbi:sugar ABC transporter ATP-binding protein [Chelatococcus sp. GCM10030263]|uniref:sugar ABC transporter ATP-binding protein n=1 Tax=Chelatococcus sp. GCM10030263 TaxID=3273387 RepID=UPI00361F7A83
MAKAFGGTLAVSGVDLDLFPGEILALLGQNGAGKSTLIKMLAGVYRPDAGEIRFSGETFDPSKNDGAISFIHQDLGLIEWMTVAENIALAQGYRRRRGLINWTAVEDAAGRSLATIAHDIDPNRRVQDLTRTEKSLVAIARALGVNARVLVLDEPTASLPKEEVELLFRVLRGLKASGVAMIYVTHRLDEVFAISDRLAVLRDGKLVDQRRTQEADADGVVRAIIGRPPGSVFVRPARQQHAPALTFDGVTIGEVGPLGFSVGRGEIVGLVGLRGAGQEMIGRALIGTEPVRAGEIRLAGAQPDLSRPPAAIASGVALVPGDRLAESVAHGLTVQENMFLNPAASGRRLFAWRRPQHEMDEAHRLGQRVGLTPNAPTAGIETLSGGNQQKVVLARWMRIGGSVLVLEDPTAGVDVGAKAEIYRLLAEAVREGQAVVLVSTDFEEVAAICHRALVFRGGQIVAELGEDQLSIEHLVRASSLTPAPTPGPPEAIEPPCNP